MKRSLTLDDVPDDLRTEYGWRDRSRPPLHRPLPQCSCPWRTCGGCRVANSIVRNWASILRGFRDGAYFKPVPVYHDAKARVFDLRDGTHRWRCSLAYGFTQIPCLLLTLDEALETGYTPR